MSEKILNALMQLFAIVANAERLTEKGRSIVESFLKQQLSQSNVLKYLAVFDDYVVMLQGKSNPDKVKKRVSVNSVKVLRICTDINRELNQKQKYVVLVRLIEFAYSSEETLSEQECEFLNIVAETFNIDRDDYDDCLLLASGQQEQRMQSSKFLLVSGDEAKGHPADKFIFQEGMSGRLFILFIRQASILFIRYSGDAALILNGTPLIKNTSYTFTQGSVIRGNKMLPLYYNDIIRHFRIQENADRLHFAVKHAGYRFKNGKVGLHPVDFSVSSGNLVGIMGGSGAGKSTLLNVLNTNLRPGEGEVLINGKNIHVKSSGVEGLIGYVPQDDLLVEDLTVFQNLFFSSKLCFGSLTDHEIRKKCLDVLESLGLFEVKELKVGSVLETTISGGQRKRLNIALELIREPSVLFVDEPTSGLSSRDSENVMDLLKQLSISGKLVFVVIHQPSSDIYKMFDRLLMLDAGGYTVYYGSPADALIYFKSKASFADAEDSECITCGNINPEQVFSIIESKVLDEFGNPTPHRKISPEEWNKFYAESIKMRHDEVNGQDEPVQVEHTRPSRFGQFLVFLQRDVLSKLGNQQYLWINLLEAPVLAFILSYFLRYSPGENYVFRDNMNLPAYIFMSVIVSLFMGLMVSAEEIIRDRKIRKRESFLNLSKFSYLTSKVTVLFIISAIQTLLYVVVGNGLTGISGMNMDYWIILFSVSCFGNLLGLNISASFNEAVTVYILIPFLIIPQILLSGIIVKFENMNPLVTSYDKVPFMGETMVAKWGFEALAVNQFKNNPYEKLFYLQDHRLSTASYKRDHWLSRISDQLEKLKKGDGGKDGYRMQLIQNEIRKEQVENETVKADETIYAATTFSMSFYDAVRKHMQNLKQHYTRMYNEAEREKDQRMHALLQQGPDAAAMLQSRYANESVEDLLLNKAGLNSISEYNGKFIRSYQPVYMSGEKGSFIRAPFLAGTKSLFGKTLPTYPVNLLVIWWMTFFLSIVLYFDWLKKLVRLLNFSQIFRLR